MAARAPHPQRLALDLDELVRALGSGDPEAGLRAGKLADEIATAWNEAGRPPLVLAGAMVRVGDAGGRGPGAAGASGVALRGAEEGERVGVWVLPASAAGLRAIRPRGTVTAGMCMELGRMLAAVNRTPRAVQGLKRTLWTGGSGAFDFACGPAMSDRLDAVATAEGVRAELDRDRARFVHAKTMAYARRMQRCDALDKAAGARMDAYIRGLGDGTVALDAGDVRDLRLSAEDGRFWARQLATTVTASDGLLLRVGPRQVACLVLEAFRQGPGLDATVAIEGLQSSLGGDDTGEEITEWLRALRREVDDESLGRAVGRGIELGSGTAERLSTIVRDQVSPFSIGVAAGILERAGGGDREVERVAAVCSEVGLQALWSRAELRDLSEPAGRGIARVLKLCDAGADAYADLVVASPATVAAWILRSAPPHIRARIEARLHQVFRRREPTENTPLVRALIASGSASSIRALGEVLLQTRGHGWAGRVVPDLCATIVKAGLGRDFLVPLFRDREADTKLRLLVLRSMEGHTDLLTEAARRRVTDLVEPKEIQVRLKAVRERLK